MSKFSATKIPSAAKAAALVKRYEAELASAQSNTKAAEVALGAARIAADEDGTGTTIVDKARKHLAACRGAEAEAEMTLSAAKALHQQAVGAEAEATLGARWDESDQLQQQREKASAELAELNGKTVAKLNEVAEITVKLWRSIPVKDPTGSQNLVEAALLGRAALLAEWRIDMATRGKWPWLAKEILWQAHPGFVERIAKAGEHLKHLRGKPAPAEDGAGV